MMHNTDKVSMYWDLIEYLEEPKVLQVRAEEIILKDNIFTQVTVRFFTKQVSQVLGKVALNQTRNVPKYFP